MLRAPWWVDLGAITAAFFFLNICFTVGYAISGGVAHAQNVRDWFFFSVQTMATIGYGVMYPESLAAHVLVTCQAIFGIFFTAVTTGMVFAKFSVPRAKVQFAKHAVVTLWDGVPTLMVRVGNQRGNQIVEATVRITLIRTEHTQEGVLMYRLYEVPPVRERQPAFSRSWTIMHQLVAGSPLYGATPESLAKSESELMITIIGTDETSAQTMHARHTYEDKDIVWGARFADMISPLADGRFQLDMHVFHDLVPTAASERFPYSVK
jgi:inward rectifier potassium channel